MTPRPRPTVAREAVRGTVAASLLALALVATGSAPPVAQGLDGQRAAAAVARIDQLEEELRRLRGRVEALEAERAQLRGQIERLERGLQARVGSLERGPLPGEVGAGEAARPGTPTVSRGGAAPPTATQATTTQATTTQPKAPQPPVPPARPTPPAVAAPPRPGAAGGTTADSDLAARRGYVLGTIPREAILGSEAGSPSASAAAERPGPAAPGAPATAAPQLAARPAPGGPTPGGASPAARYAAARELLQKGDWAAAEDALRRYVEDFPSDPQVAIAAYWLGETYLVREDWQNAAAAFARNYRTYGADSPRAADNLLKLGVALARLGDRDKACQTFAELDRRHANASSAVRQALARERVAAGCS